MILATAAAQLRCSSLKSICDRKAHNTEGRRINVVRLRPKLDTFVSTRLFDLLPGEHISKRQVGRLLERRKDQAELISPRSGRNIN